VLAPTFEGQKPKPEFLRIWPDDDEDVPLVISKFGVVPKGSVLSYQQPPPNVQPVSNICKPDFVLPDLTYPRSVRKTTSVL
jgi:hypothetical protein